MSTKINAIHLQRDAYVYVRQSTGHQGHQVRAHPESQRRQYALADQARGLGFAHVIVIDEDVGRSGTGRHERPGFGQRLAAAHSIGLRGRPIVLRCGEPLKPCFPVSTRRLDDVFSPDR
jgi:hypothetical protein